MNKPLDFNHPQSLKDPSVWIESLKYFSQRYKNDDTNHADLGTASNDEDDCLSHLRKTLKR